MSNTLHGFGRGCQNNLGYEFYSSHTKAQHFTKFPFFCDHTKPLRKIRISKSQMCRCLLVELSTWRSAQTTKATEAATHCSLCTLPPKVRYTIWINLTCPHGPTSATNNPLHNSHNFPLAWAIFSAAPSRPSKGLVAGQRASNGFDCAEKCASISRSKR